MFFTTEIYLILFVQIENENESAYIINRLFIMISLSF